MDSLFYIPFDDLLNILIFWDIEDLEYFIRYCEDKQMYHHQVICVRLYDTWNSEFVEEKRIELKKLFN